MDKKDLLAFIMKTETMVTPKKVATVFQGAQMMKKLPLGIQKFVMKKASQKDPDIGFIVEPYSFFMAYEILDTQEAERYLPPDYRWISASIFEETPPRPCAIIGAFNIHTSVFWGSRYEFYLIAENKKTGLLSWIILDYESNTISYDPGRGFLMPSTERSVLTTSYTGELIIDMAGKDNPSRLALSADLKTGSFRRLNERLWIEGNLSVDYAGDLNSRQAKPFGLVFDPDEMSQALKIPPESVKIRENSLGTGILSDRPFEVCCFPYAQHFLTTSIPLGTTVKSREDLETAVKKAGSGRP